MHRERTQLEWRKNFLLPVSVNVASAALLLLGVLIFKDPLLNFFSGSRQEYPVYCVPESVPNKLNPELMDVELFIINRRVELVTFETLDKFLEEEASKRGVPPRSSDLVLRPRKRVEIKNVVGDCDFNRGKGEVHVIRPPAEGGEWRVRVQEMSASAILKV